MRLFLPPSCWLSSRSTTHLVCIHDYSCPQDPQVLTPGSGPVSEEKHSQLHPHLVTPTAATPNTWKHHTKPIQSSTTSDIWCYSIGPTPLTIAALLVQSFRNRTKHWGCTQWEIPSSPESRGVVSKHNIRITERKLRIGGQHLLYW
jgi:hypothetical protein